MEKRFICDPRLRISSIWIYIDTLMEAFTLHVGRLGA
jgi:hypothetical protein